MGGLLLLLAGVVWLLVCITLAGWLTSRVRNGGARLLSGCLLFVVLLAAPFVDDILGSRAFKRYCGAADAHVKVLGNVYAHPRTGLFSTNGEWRLDHFSPSQHEDRSRLMQAADSLVRWDHGVTVPTANGLGVQERTPRIYKASSEHLVAQFTSYHYRGGILRKSFLESADQCFPKRFGSALYREIFARLEP